MFKVCKVCDILDRYVCFKADDTVVSIPFKSRHVRLVLKGPDHLCKSW